MALSMAARASSSSTPASSKRMRPGCTTATHSSGLPLPDPIRVSAGLWVTGLSGKTRIPKSPNDTAAPPLAWPFKRPRCVLRCLTFLGINMSVRLLAEVRGLVVLVPVLALHLLVLGQLALQVVGLGRRNGQEIGHRSLGGIVRLVGVSVDVLGHGGRIGGVDRGRLVLGQQFLQQLVVGCRAVG